jgi:membrane protease YdiL (CAAX protease family)
MEKETPSQPANSSRVLFFAAFLLFGLLLFVLFNHIRPLLPPTADLIGRVVLIAALFFAALAARRSRRFEIYRPILFSGFVAALAGAVDLYFPSRDWLLQAFGIPLRSPAGLALDKLDSSLIIILSIILLTRISGAGLGSIFLRRGNLRQGLTIGLIAFAVAAAGSIPVSELFFGGKDLQVPKVLGWTPWILIFVLGNAFNEELLFRGLFLRKFEPFAGRLFSNLAIAVPFALHHSGVSYTPDVLIFLAILIPLALAWGWITQKSGSLWGSVLFHAGTDIPIVLGLFSALG